MSTDNNKIKIFQIDDWAYVAAESEQDACDFIAADAARPDDPEAWECSEMTRGKHADLEALLAAHIESGGTFPGLIGIDAHYQ